MERNPDVIIVGGGIAGMAAAIRVGDAGMAATVLERAPAIGGRARSQRKDGYTLNFGPHALYADAERELEDLGVTLAGGRPRTDGLAIANGRAYRLPTGTSSLLRTGLYRGFARAKAARVLTQITRVDPATARGLTLAQWLDRNAGHGRPRQAAEAYFRLGCYANAPEHLDAEVALRQLQAGAAGVRYLDGGWQTMVDALRTRAESLGVRFTESARATAVQAAGHGVTVQTAGGTAMSSGAAILAVPPREALTLLGETAPRETQARLRNVVPARAAFLDVGLRSLPNPEGSFALGIDRPLYLQTHSLYADLAPADGVLVSTAMYIPPGDEAEAAESRAEMEGLLDIAQPGWRDLVTMQSFTPDLVVQHALPLAGTGRPGVASGIPGVSFAGDWVGMDGLLSKACLSSARVAARQAVAAARERRPLAAAVAQ